jgi:hypothetical protein
MEVMEIVLTLNSYSHKEDEDEVTLKAPLNFKCLKKLVVRFSEENFDKEKSLVEIF